jgi:hypothetical protein
MCTACSHCTHTSAASITRCATRMSYRDCDPKLEKFFPKDCDSKRIVNAMEGCTIAPAEQLTPRPVTQECIEESVLSCHCTSLPTDWLAMQRGRINALMQISKVLWFLQFSVFYQSRPISHAHLMHKTNIATTIPSSAILTSLASFAHHRLLVNAWQ